jgi:hypothetical protein
MRSSRQYQRLRTAWPGREVHRHAALQRVFHGLRQGHAGGELQRQRAVGALGLQRQQFDPLRPRAPVGRPRQASSQPRGTQAQQLASIGAAGGAWWMARRVSACGSGRRRSRPARHRGCGQRPWRDCRPAAAGGRARRVQAARAWGHALQKRVDAVGAFGLEDRAGGVDQSPAGPQQRPQACSSSDWMRASADRSSGRRSQRMSGWRRTMPDALHGASSRIASKGRPSHQCAVAGVGRLHLRLQVQAGSVSWMRGMRFGSLSSASRSRSASSSRCAVLPPGAAQASSTRAPGGQASAPEQHQARGALRRGVLHRHVAIGEAGQLLHRAGLGQHHGLAGQRRVVQQRGRAAGGGQPLHVVGAVQRRALTRSVIGGCSLAESAAPATALGQSWRSVRSTRRGGCRRPRACSTPATRASARARSGAAPR